MVVAGSRREFLTPTAIDTDRGAVLAPTIPSIASWRHRPALLIIAVLLLTVVASVVTHAAGAGSVGPEVAPEASESAEQSALVLPPLIGPLGGLLLIGCVWLVRRGSVSSLWFMSVPPLAFGLQELAERLLHVGSVPSAGAEPSPLATLLVQVPFALLAFGLARLLRAGVRKVIRFLRAHRRWPRIRPAFTSSWPLVPTRIPNRPALAGAHFGRAPPDPR